MSDLPDAPTKYITPVTLDDSPSLHQNRSWMGVTPFYKTHTTHESVLALHTGLGADQCLLACFGARKV